MSEIEKRFTPGPGVLCIGGSPRKGGNTDVILETICARLKARAVPCQAIHLRDLDFSPCLGCEACRKDHQCHTCQDDMQDLYPLVVQSQGLILVSPTHHYNVTAWMKAFIDRMYCFYRFQDTVPRGWSSVLAGQGRQAAVIAVCEQAAKEDMGFTLPAMRLPLEAFGYEILDEVGIFKVFERAGIRSQTRVMDRLEQTADRFQVP